MKKIILLTIIISTSLLFWCSKKDNLSWTIISDNPVITENIYQNKENNFSLIIPQWRTFKENIYWSVLMIFSPKISWDKINENIWITIKPVLSWASLESLYNQNKDMITKTIPWANIIDQEDLIINNKSAKSISYNFIQWEYKIKQEQYIILDNEKNYIITYMALADTFNDYKNDLEKIIWSFKF